MVMVTGSGRSGTSTVAGALARLGLHVPQPEKPADERNSRGYYESMWVVQFHGDLLNAVPVRSIDARPHAMDITNEVGRDPEVRRQIGEWLDGHLDHPRLLVKDPRAFWLHEAWREVTAARGIELSFLTMLRHPLEVAKSRDTAYLGALDDERRRVRETANVAAWCNSAFIAERVMRGYRRSFVRYDDLLADWRAALAPVGEELGVDLDVPRADQPHAVDGFIDVELRRSRLTWEDSGVPTALQEVAERTWDALGRLVGDSHNPDAIAELDEVRDSYLRLHADALAVTFDHITGVRKELRHEVRRNQADIFLPRLEDLRRRNAELLQRVEAMEARRPVHRARRVAGRAARRIGLRRPATDS